MKKEFPSAYIIRENQNVNLFSQAMEGYNILLFKPAYSISNYYYAFS